ncbi:MULTISPECIES: hypothetical protein [Furfurilactobacillus]|uniref:hypothetical protein n=1 Tax=Furfurilactobacillus milii TaxID=2888272 RepID=UPI00136B953A|nr:hypothetical protein [Furfurilactobacillus milii]
MKIKDFILRLLVLITVFIALFGTFVIGFDNVIVQAAYFAILLEVLGYYTIFKGNHKS